MIFLSGPCDMFDHTAGFDPWARHSHPESWLFLVEVSACMNSLRLVCSYDVRKWPEFDMLTSLFSLNLVPLGKR
eukprot:2506912-Amphidinium_carterae.1